MLFTITGKHIDVTEAMKRHAEDRTSKLPRYYDSINQIEVIVDGGQGGNVNVEVIAPPDPFSSSNLVVLVG